MKGRTETLIVIVGALLLASTSAAFAQAAAAKPQAAAAAPTKFVTPFKGEATIEKTASATKRNGDLVVTTFKVKNMSPGPLIGFKVDEYWYSKKGDTVSGSQSFRVQKPFMPGEIIEVTLRSPYNAQMDRNMTMFAHTNGKAKVKQVTKFSS